MKKVLFLMFLLLLIVLGTANVNAQVRIGGNGAPNAAAVLDLNADESATPAANKGALALPRVSLASTTAPLNGATPINGMLVYNTGGSLSAGIYFYDGSNWMSISGDGVIGNELTDTISGGGLTRSGAGTAASPFLVGIKAGGVTLDKMSAAKSDSGLLLAVTPSGSITTVPSPYTNFLFDTRTQPALLSPFVATTLVKIYDAVVTMDMKPGARSIISVPGIIPTDGCKDASQYSVFVTTGTDRIIFSQINQNTTGGSTAQILVKCYRLSV